MLRRFTYIPLLERVRTGGAALLARRLRAENFAIIIISADDVLRAHLGSEGRNPFHDDNNYNFTVNSAS